MSSKPYKRFSPDVDFSKFDHIVVGSGIGGLTAATWLAKTGAKVAVLERHYVPGGFTHTFKRKQGFEWDVGLHYIGNVGKEGSLRRLFDFLTSYNLEWELIGDVYDVVHIGEDIYKFKAGKENFRRQLISYFPEEVEAISSYLELIEKSNKRGSAFFFEKTFKPLLSKTLGWFFRKRYEKFSQRTTYDVLSEITSNKRLIAVLCAQCGNYGLTPKKSSFGAHAMVINHFMEGGYYPVGGADKLYLNTIDTLNKLGGEVFIRADVQEIIVEKNKVKGLQVGDTFIPCKSVISNTGVDNTFNRLLAKQHKKTCNFNLQSVKPSSGHLCLYVGLDKSDFELDLPKHNVWSFDNEDYDLAFEEMNLQNAPNKFAYISFPSAKDPDWEKKHPGTSTIQALTFGNYEWFSKYENLPWMKRGEEYETLKSEFENTMLEKLYGLFPQLKGHVVVTEVSSPLSTKHFSNYQHGEIYGLAHTPERFRLPFLRPETKIKGLRLVGQDITLVGVAGAMLSGMLCAITILKYRVWKVFKGMGDAKKDQI